jgi:hypothetical protein
LRKAAAPPAEPLRRLAHAGRSARLATLVSAYPEPPRRAAIEDSLLGAYSAAFVCAAVYHLLCAAIPAWSAGASPARHALFVLINSALALGMVKRPRGFVTVFAILCLQQLVSHGGDLVRTLREHGQIDGMSMLVLVALPPAWLLSLRAKRAERQRES